MNTIDAMKTLTHVAIEYAGKVYSLPPPNRHHNVIRLIADENGVGIKGPDVQGFLDEDGRFYSRIAAMQLAKDNGQLRLRPATSGYQGQELYSEDVW